MLRHLPAVKTLWTLTVVLALAASVMGIANPAIYEGVVDDEIMPGVLSQDILVAIASLIALVLTLTMKPRHVTRPILILGCLGVFFYVYGIYAIEQIYNLLYVLYLAILGLSFYAIVYGVANVRQELFRRVRVGDLVHKLSVAWSVITPVVFYPLWISQLVPLLQTGNRIEYTFSIYILDLCFIMPAFGILAVRGARKDGLALLLMPALFITGFGVLAPLAGAEALKPLVYDRPMDPAGFWMFLVLSLVYLGLTVAYLVTLKVGRAPKRPKRHS